MHSLEQLGSRIVYVLGPTVVLILRALLSVLSTYCPDLVICMVMESDNLICQLFFSNVLYTCPGLFSFYLCICGIILLLILSQILQHNIPWISRSKACSNRGDVKGKNTTN